MNTSTINREKIRAALDLLMDETTTLQKFEKIRALILGVNPKIDKSLREISNAISNLKKIENIEVIDLSISALPEKNEKEKKRKKLLLLLLSSWKNLRSEVERVQNLYEKAGSDKEITTSEHASVLGKSLALAKGPLGFVTIGAIAIVGVITLLNAISVTIIIRNQGCSPIQPIVRLPVPIPGIELPKETIPDGGEGVAKVPPLTVNVDGTNRSSVVLSAFSFSMQYELGSGATDVIFNGQTLLGKQTVIKLSESKQHEVILVCSSS